MGFYEETLLPMIKKTVAVIEKTPHMQDILHGTMPDDRFRFQIKQNYNYLMEFTKCWAVGFAKCNGKIALSQAIMFTLMFVCAFSPRVHSILRGPL